MKLSDFKVGSEFTMSEHRYRCTDVGTRVVVAIPLQHDDDPSWYNGPPYVVPELVIDEFDQEGCELIGGASE